MSSTLKTLYAPNGLEIVATAETVSACCRILGGVRGKDGKITFEHEGGSEIYWDTMTTEELDGEVLFQDSAGGLWRESQLSVKGGRLKPMPTEAELTRKPFTVLIRFPDYLGNWPDDQAVHRVRAATPAEALKFAQEAEFALPQHKDAVNDADDFALVAIFNGHVNLLAGAATSV